MSSAEGALRNETNLSDEQVVSLGVKVVGCKYDKTRRGKKDEPKQRSSLMSRCLRPRAEVGIGEPAGMDILEEPPERRGVGHVGGRLVRPSVNQNLDGVGDNNKPRRESWTSFFRTWRFGLDRR